MSQQRILEAAKRAWLESDSVESFTDFLEGQKKLGRFWGA